MKTRITDSSGLGYSVFVNPEVAFTIVYEDQFGRLLFCIEVGDDPQAIYLNRIPSTQGRLVEVNDRATKARVELALERVTAYFRSKGKSVELE